MASRSGAPPDETIRAIFPEALATDVEAVLAILEPGGGYERHRREHVVVGGESVAVLARLYRSEPTDESISALSARQQLVLHALFTRHDDGYVRQRHLTFLRGHEPWLVPFVLELIGEYVVEIQMEALNGIEGVPAALYQEFAQANPAYMTLLRRRVVSYFFAYHWRRSTKWALLDYPGYRFLEALAIWNGPEGRHLLAGARRMRLRSPHLTRARWTSNFLLSERTPPDSSS